MKVFLQIFFFRNFIAHLEIVGAEEVVANEETIAEETVEEAPEETIEGLNSTVFEISKVFLENIASEEIIQSEGIGEEVSVGNDEKKDNDSDDSDNDDNDNDLKKPVDNLNSDSGKSTAIGNKRLVVQSKQFFENFL